MPNNVIQLPYTAQEIQNLLSKCDSISVDTGFPNGSKTISLQLNQQGQVFTAPSNGWYQMTASAIDVDTSYLNPCNATAHIYNTVFGKKGFDLSTYVPARKGDRVSMYYSIGAKTPNLTFTPAYNEGDN